MTPSTRSITRISLLLFSLLAASSMLAQSSPQLPNPGNTSVTREQQIQLGFQAAAEVYKQMPVLPDNSPETQYIRQLGERLVATIPQEYSWPFQFHTIAQKDINAFALPGGPMFVNVGTINAAANEAELAGVMAHEMAHVYMQHSAKQMEKAAKTQLFAGILGALAGMRGGALGSLAQAGIQFGAGTVMLKYSRTDEAQADAVGAIILYRAGYNPRALAAFFKTLSEESGGGSGPQFLSDHPNPGNREQAILNQVQSWPPKQFRTNSAAFNQVRQHAQTLKLYTAQEIAEGAKTGRWEQLNRENGAVFKAPSGVQVQPTSGSPSQPSDSRGSGDVVPSSRLVTENLGPFSIARPSNWEVVTPQKRGQSLMIAPRSGLTQNGLGYGVLINDVRPPNGTGNIDQITSEIVRGLQGQGGDLQTVGDAQPITAGGVRGRSVMMESTSPLSGADGQSQRERDWLVTLPQPDGSVTYLVFVSPKSEFQNFKPTFDNMLRSLQF